MGLFRAWAAGWWVQCIAILVEPASFLLTAFLMPLFTSITFLFIFQYTGRLHHLAMYGIVGPVILSLWTTAVFNSGDLIEVERFNQTLEILLASPPGSAEAALLGAISANTVLSLVALAETMFIAHVGFGVALQIVSPLLLLAGLLLLILSTCAAALIMANAFVLARTTRLFQNTLTYPLYLLAGLAFPLTALPGWLRPFSAVVTLSWAGDVLGAALGLPASYPAPVSLSLGLLLTGLYAVCGHLLFRWTEKRVRQLATLGSQ